MPKPSKQSKHTSGKREIDIKPSRSDYFPLIDRTIHCALETKKMYTYAFTAVPPRCIVRVYGIGSDDTGRKFAVYRVMGDVDFTGHRYLDQVSRSSR